MKFTPKKIEVNHVAYTKAVKDAEETDRMFEILMGEDVPDRRAFIERHAKEVTNLDI